MHYNKVCTTTGTLKTSGCGRYQRICLQKSLSKIGAENAHNQIQSSPRNFHTKIKFYTPMKGALDAVLQLTMS
jgi:hypothetical protein